MCEMNFCLPDPAGWTPPEVPAEIPHGDMPGDKVRIEQNHIEKANRIYPPLLRALHALQGEGRKKVVLSVFGGSGVDVPILLNSTPEETREHRRLRARDGKTDSAFTTMVLEIEQAAIAARWDAAKIVISKSGEILKEPL